MSYLYIVFLLLSVVVEEIKRRGIFSSGASVATRWRLRGNASEAEVRAFL